MNGLVVCQGPADGDERSYNGLHLAGALAKGDGTDVKVFLIGDAAGCAIAGQKVPDGYYHLERAPDRRAHWLDMGRGRRALRPLLRLASGHLRSRHRTSGDPRRRRNPHRQDRRRHRMWHRAIHLTPGASGGTVTLEAALYSPRALPFIGVRGPVIEQIGRRVAPGAGAFNILTIDTHSQEHRQ